MKLAELFVEIMANTAGMSFALGGAEGQLRGFAATAASIGMEAGRAFAEALRGAIEEAMHLETEFVQVDKAVDLGPALGKFKEDLFAMSTELKGISIQSLLDIAVGAGKGGIPTDSLLEFTEGVAKLSVALDDIPAGDITDSLIQVNAAFKLPQQTLINLGSAIDKVADSGALKASDLFRAMQRLAGPANALGLTVDQLAGLSGALLNSGLNADAAADGLRELFMRLGNPESVKGLAEVLGVEFEDLKRQIQTGPMEVIDQLLKKLSTKDLFGANEIFEKLKIGSQVASGHLLTLSRSVDTVGQFTGLAAEQLRTGAQAADSYGKAAATTAAQMVTMQNQIDIAQAKIGEAFLPAVTELFQLLGDLADAFASNGEATRGWGEALVEVIRSVRIAVNDIENTKIRLGTELFADYFEGVELLIGKDAMMKVFGFDSTHMREAGEEAARAAFQNWNAKVNKPAEEEDKGPSAVSSLLSGLSESTLGMGKAIEEGLQEQDFQGFLQEVEDLMAAGRDDGIPDAEGFEAYIPDEPKQMEEDRRSAMSLEQFADSLMNSSMNDEYEKRQVELAERTAKATEEMNRKFGDFEMGTI